MQHLIEPPFTNALLELGWHEYRGAVGVNPSWIVHGFTSMKHFRAAKDEKSNITRAKQIGSLVHAMVLEPDNVEERFAVWSGSRRYGNDYQLLVENHTSAGLEEEDIVRLDDHDKAQCIASAIRSHKPSMELIDATAHEVSIFAEDCGVQCKGRVDGLGSGKLIDIKTTGSVERRTFGRQFARLNYACKIECYRRWAESLGHTIDEVLLIVAESEPPYDVCVVPVDINTTLSSAWGQVESVLRRIPFCIQSDSWPGVAESGHYELEIPNWAMAEEQILDWS